MPLQETFWKFATEGEDAVVAAWEKIGKAASQVTNTVTKPLAPIAAAAGTAFGAAKGAGGIATAPIIKATDVTLGLYVALDKVTNKFGGFASQLGHFVEQVSPASVRALDYAFTDLTATIGEKLKPLLDAIVPIINEFADYIGNLNLTPLIENLGEFINVLADKFFGALDILQPAINAIIDLFAKVLDILSPLADVIGDLFLSALKALEPVIEGLVSIFDRLVDAILWVWNKIADMIEAVTSKIPGIDTIDIHVSRGGSGGRQEKREARRAARSAQGGRATGKRALVTTDILGAQRRAQEAAANVGVTSAADKTAANTEAIKRYVEEMRQHWEKQVSPETKAEISRAADIAKQNIGSLVDNPTFNWLKENYGR